MPLPEKVSEPHAMPRYSEVISTGRTIAKGIYHLPYLALIDWNDRQSLVLRLKHRREYESADRWTSSSRPLLLMMT
jgi:hypothetical protein